MDDLIASTGLAFRALTMPPFMAESTASPGQSPARG
jgi:hypothetical protein